MKTINVSEATKTQLNWLVAIALGAQQVKTPESQSWMLHWPSPLFGDQPRWSMDAQGYTTDWSQMGPIIEREGINMSVNYQDDALGEVMHRVGWKADMWNNSVPGTSGFLKWAYGDTVLVAAARVYVMAKLGKEVEVPEELK